MSNQFSSSVVEAAMAARFKAADFKEKVYEGQEETFLTKIVPASQFTYVKEHIVDDEYIFPESICVVELCDNGMLQLCIDDGDYLEQYDYEDFEAWKAMAVNAGVVF